MRILRITKPADRNGMQVSPRRSGAALSELALVLPLLMLIVFGGIETADMVFLKESLKSVSYEGGRAVAKYNSTNAQVLERITALIDARQLVGATVELTLPADADDVSETQRGQTITVTISAPAERNTVGPLRMYRGRTISASTTMVRE